MLRWAAAVLADQTVLDAIGQADVDGLRDRLLAGLAGGDATAAICDTVRAAGEKLVPALPRAAGDVNELPDASVLVD